MPQQRYHHPILVSAKVDRIREGLGEDAAEVLVNSSVSLREPHDFGKLCAKRGQKSVAQLTSSFFVIPSRRGIDVVPDFWKNANLFHPRRAFTNASNCSIVIAREGSRSKRSHRESSSRFSASLTSGSSVDSPIDCHKTSTSMSFSLTGSAWSLRSSFEFMVGVSVPAFGIQVPDSRQRAFTLPVS